MLEAWSELNLQIPPISNYAVKATHCFDVEKFKTLFEKAIKYFANQNEYDEEISQISRYVYLNKNQLRMMKGFHEMIKALQAAKKYMRLNFVGVLEVFNSFIATETNSVPHQQNLDYVLMRMLAVSKIFIRLVICLRNSARYFLGLVRAGSFYIKGTIIIATLSSAWDKSRELCKYTVNLYNQLVVHRDKLVKLKDLKWEGDGFNFPREMDTWLGPEYRKFVANETYDVKLLTKENEIEAFNQNKIKNVLDNMKTNASEITKEIAVDRKIYSENELEDYTPLERNEKSDQRETVPYNHLISALTTKGSIKLFLSIEDKYRKVDAEKSLTIKKMNRKNWKHFKSDIKNKLILMQEGSLVNYVQDYLSDFLT